MFFSLNHNLGTAVDYLTPDLLSHQFPFRILYTCIFYGSLLTFLKA